MKRLLLPTLLAILFCAGCVTPQKCLTKFGQDTLKITVRDTVVVHVPVPADSMTGSISRDTLQELMAGTIDSLTAISESKDIRIKFWYDKYNGALHYHAKVNPDTVTIDVPVEVTVPCPPVVVVDPKAPGRFERLWIKFSIFFSVPGAGGSTGTGHRSHFQEGLKPCLSYS